METDNNILSASSHQIEELHPRQVPKALSFNKVTPVPSVPDVSLVFDNNPKISSRFHKLNSTDASSNTYHGNYGHDENEPRTIKPAPIAPLPNESYTTWRARAMNSQCGENESFPRSSFSKGNDRQLRFNASSFTPPIVHDKNEPLDKFHESTSQQNYQIASQKTTLGHSASHVPSSKSVIEKTASNMRPFSHRGQASKQSVNMSHYIQDNRHYSLPKSVIANEPVEYNASHLNRRHVRHLMTKDLGPDFIEPHTQSTNEQRNNDKDVPLYSRQPLNMHSHIDCESNCQASSTSCESRRDDVDKKRDAVRDIYRIVQLQNEQIKSLQSQVERLLKKNNSEPQRRAESPKPNRKSVGTQYTEDGTQTSSLEENMVSIGVMTSFIGLNNGYSSPNSNKHNITTHCNKCDGCKCGSVQEDNLSDGYNSKGENIQEVLQNSRKCSTAHKSPDNHQCDSPKIMRNIHQIIEEENESDDSLRSRGGVVRKTDLPTQDSSNQNKTVACSRGKNAIKNPAAVEQIPNVEKCTSEKIESHSPMNYNGQITNSPTPKTDKTPRNERGVYARHKSQPRDLQNVKCCPYPNNHLASKTRHNDEEMTMTLNGVDLQTVTDPHISPEPSIHVEIQDYHEFSEDDHNSSNDEGSYSSGNESMCSGEDREQLENGEAPQNKQMPGNEYFMNQDKLKGDARVSWTFYDNVLGQVNKLLGNQGGESHPRDIPEMSNQNVIIPNRPQVFEPTPSAPLLGISDPKFPNPLAPSTNAVPTLEDVREATLQHLRQLGINVPCEDKFNLYAPVIPTHNVNTPEAHVAESRRNMAFNHHYIPPGRAPRERHPTETSLRINALAAKYLSDEQLAGFGHLGLKKNRVQNEPVEFAEQQAPRLGKGVIGEVSSADFTLYGMNGANLSFTTLRYLQRYQLMPCTRANAQGIWRHQGGAQQGNYPEGANARGANVAYFTKASPDCREEYRPVVGESTGVSPREQGAAQHSSIPSHRTGEIFSSDGVPVKRGTKGDLQFAGNNQGIASVPPKRIPDPGGNRANNQLRKMKSKASADQVKNLDRHRKGIGQNDCLSPNHQRRAQNRPRESDVLGDTIQKTQSSNILDITTLRQQPKLL